MDELGRREQVGRAVRARRHAGAAADALRGVHRRVGDRLGDRDQVGVGRTTGRRGDEAADLDDAVERRTVDHQVLDDRERRRPPRLDDDLVAAVEHAHVQLARRRAALRAVGLAVDHQRARAADALAAVVVEDDRVLALLDQPLVEDVEQLEERRLVADLGDLVGLEATLLVGAVLAPDLEGEVGRARSLVAPRGELDDLVLQLFLVFDRGERIAGPFPGADVGEVRRRCAAPRSRRSGAPSGSGRRSSPHG